MTGPSDSQPGGPPPPATAPRAGVSAWRRLDPRRSLAAAIGWMVLVVCAGAGLVAGELAARMAERQVRQDGERLLAQLAQQTRQTLDGNLTNRLALVQAAAAQFEARQELAGPGLRRQLEALQASFPEFAWLGLTDEGGTVRIATGGLLEGQSVRARPWFQAGLRGPWLGDVHEAVMLDRFLRTDATQPALRFVDAVVPLRDGQDQRMVLGAHLSWRWIEELQRETLRVLGPHPSIEVLLVSADRTVLAGPAPWTGRSVPTTDLSEGGEYLFQAVGGEGPNGRPRLDWTVVVRQPKALALDAAGEVRRRVFGTVLLAACLAAALAIALALALTRQLRRLARDAQDVAAGRRHELPRPAGVDEIAHIGGALAGAVGQLQREKDALAALNSQLDAKVAERTRELTELVQENQRLGAARERLRLARDVHDSLANTLVGLLNELRLLRRLRELGRWEEFEQRLDGAEAIVAQGLAEARASITQMRHNNVAEQGLGSALADLLERFSARTGVAHRLAAPPGDLGIPAEQAEAGFRIAEEALRNVERHAAANVVKLTLQKVGSGGWRLSVEDDGRGFDPNLPTPGHYGLRGLREQAASLGALLAIDSEPGRGTRVALQVPPVRVGGGW